MERLLEFTLNEIKLKEQSFLTSSWHNRKLSKYKIPVTTKSYLPGAPNQPIPPRNIYYPTRLKQGHLNLENNNNTISNSCLEQAYILDEETGTENQRALIKWESGI